MCVRACVHVDHLLNGDVFSDHVLHSTDLSHHTQLHADIEGVVVVVDDDDDDDDDDDNDDDAADDDDDDNASDYHTQLQADDNTAPHSQEARLVALGEREKQQPQRTLEEQSLRGRDHANVDRHCSRLRLLSESSLRHPGSHSRDSMVVLTV